MASDFPTGISRSSPSNTGASDPGYEKAKPAHSDPLGRHAGGVPLAGRQEAGRPRAGLHGSFEAEDGGNRGGRTVEGPVQPPERNETRPNHGLCIHGHLAHPDTPGKCSVSDRPEDHEVRDDNDQHAPNHGLLPQPRGLVLELEEAGAAYEKTIEGPVGQAEKTHLLGGRRIDRQAVDVVRLSLSLANLVGVAVPPDTALAQQPVRGQPGGREEQRRPPGVGRQDGCESEASEQLNQSGGDEIHARGERRSRDSQVKVARHAEVRGHLGVLEVPHPRQAHAGQRQAVVEPRGGSVSQVGADRSVNGRQDLQRHEHGSHDSQRASEWPAILDRPYQHSYRDGEDGRQNSAQDEHGPPGRSQPRIRSLQSAEELQLLPRTQVFQHWRSSEGMPNGSSGMAHYLPVFLVPRRWLFAAVPSLAPARPTVAATAGLSSLTLMGPGQVARVFIRRRQCEGCGLACWRLWRKCRYPNDAGHVFAEGGAGASGLPQVSQNRPWQRKRIVGHIDAVEPRIATH